MQCVLLISAASIWEEFPGMGIEPVTLEMRPQTHVGPYISQSTPHDERQSFYGAESDRAISWESEKWKLQARGLNFE